MGRRFRARIRGLLGGAALLACAPAAVTAFNLHEQVLPRAQWPQHANGRNVAALPAVAEALRRFEENGKIVIVIRYPGGDSGRQWARELHDWLVGLGVPGRYLELQPGAGAEDRLIVSIIERG
ncbi:MAG: hypothetical protein OXU96_07705 [Gammaproteobacteria bacterium]|nr:hypothetical protein [Gammaproteobacteria bacterium]